MKTITNNQLLTASLVVTGFFSCLFLNAYVVKLNTPVLGAIQEMITLPFLVAQVVLFTVVSTRLPKKGSLRDLPLLASFTMLFISVTVTFGSFFVES